jgi:hypothetical protein
MTSSLIGKDRLKRDLSAKLKAQLHLEGPKCEEQCRFKVNLNGYRINLHKN